MLELIGVTKRYKDKTVLKDIDLKIDDGEFVCIKGGSGEGKSTLLNILGLFDCVSEGQYKIDGVDVSMLKKQHAAYRAHKFGFVFQAYYLIEDLSVYDNVILPLIYSGAKGREAAEIDALLQRFGIEEIKNVAAKKLSGGEKQRAAFVRAIINDPSCILCDEPTGNLDPRNTQIICQFLNEENKAGKTVVLITHDDGVYDLAKSYGAKIYEIKQQQIRSIV